MTCSLNPNLARDHYTISPNSARLLSNAVQDMGIRSISAVIYARNHTHNTDIQVAIMRRTELNPQTTEIIAEISPPIYSIRILLQPSQQSRIIQSDMLRNNGALRSDHFPSQAGMDILNLLGIVFTPNMNSSTLEPAQLHSDEENHGQEYPFNVVTFSSL